MARATTKSEMIESATGNYEKMLTLVSIDEIELATYLMFQEMKKRKRLTGAEKNLRLVESSVNGIAFAKLD
jgi:hypothetical protein